MAFKKQLLVGHLCGKAGLLNGVDPDPGDQTPWIQILSATHLL